jgi:hypothetical protein
MVFTPSLRAQVASRMPIPVNFREKEALELAGFPEFVSDDGRGGAGPVSRGGTLSLSFDALESAGVNTQPRVIRVVGGSNSLVAPGLEAGDVLFLGGMKMQFEIYRPWFLE